MSAQDTASHLDKAKNTKDDKKQQELDALKAKIFVGKAKDLVSGYMESLIGEKLKVYEDENDTQQALEFAQQRIKESVKHNTKSLVQLEDPSNICYRNTHSIDDSIKEIEAGLKNQMYSQLAKIWKDDADRKRGLKSSKTTKQSKLQFSTLNSQKVFGLNDMVQQSSNMRIGNNVTSIRYLNASTRSVSMGQQPLHASDTKVGLPLGRSMLQNIAEKSANDLKLADQRFEHEARNTFEQQLKLKDAFQKKKMSEISSQNLQILHKSQAVIEERHKQKQMNIKSTMATAITAVQSGVQQNAYEQTPEPTDSSKASMRFADRSMPRLDLARNNKSSVSDNALASPLNYRLEQMKRNLHNMVYDHSMPERPQPSNQTELAPAHSGQESSAGQDPNQHIKLSQAAIHASIIQDLKDVNSADHTNVANQPLFQQFLNPKILESPQHHIKYAGSIYSRDSEQPLGPLGQTMDMVAPTSYIISKDEVSPTQATAPVLEQSREQTMTHEHQDDQGSNSVQRLQSVGSPSQSPPQKQSHDIPERSEAIEGDIEMREEVLEEGATAGHDPRHEAPSSSRQRGQGSHPKQRTSEQGQAPGTKQLPQMELKKLNIDNIVQLDQSMQLSDSQQISQAPKEEALGYMADKNKLHMTLPNEQVNSYDLAQYQDADVLPQRQTIYASSTGQATAAEGQSINSDKSDPEYPEEFSDKAFEANFEKLVNRLNRNLWEHDRKDLLVTQIKDEIENQKIEKEIAAGTYGIPQPPKKGAPVARKQSNQSPFKSSHLSYLQALVSNREQYARRLKQYDQFKSMSHQFVDENNKRSDTLRSPQYRDSLLSIFQPPNSDSASRMQLGLGKLNNSSTSRAMVAPLQQVLSQSGRQQASTSQLIADGAEQPSQQQIDAYASPHQRSLHRINSPSSEMLEHPEESSVTQKYIIMVPNDQQPGQAQANSQQLPTDDQYDQFYYNNNEQYDFQNSNSQPALDLNSRIQNQIAQNQWNHQKISAYMKHMKKHNDPSRLRIQAGAVGPDNGYQFDVNQHNAVFGQQLDPNGPQLPDQLNFLSYEAQLVEGRLQMGGQQLHPGVQASQQPFQHPLYLQDMKHQNLNSTQQTESVTQQDNQNFVDKNDQGLDIQINTLHHMPNGQLSSQVKMAGKRESGRNTNSSKPAINMNVVTNDDRLQYHQTSHEMKVNSQKSLHYVDMSNRNYDNRTSQDDITLSVQGHGSGGLLHTDVSAGLPQVNKVILDSKKLNEDLYNLAQNEEAVGQQLEEEQLHPRKPVEIAQLDQMSAVRSGRSSKFETKTVLKPKIVGLSPHLRGYSNHNQHLPNMDEILNEAVEQENESNLLVNQYPQEGDDNNSRAINRQADETALTLTHTNNNLKNKNDSTLSKKSHTHTLTHDAAPNRTQGFSTQKTLAQQLGQPHHQQLAEQVFEVKKISISPKLSLKDRKQKQHFHSIVPQVAKQLLVLPEMEGKRPPNPQTQLQYNTTRNQDQSAVTLPNGVRDEAAINTATLERARSFQKSGSNQSKIRMNSQHAEHDGAAPFRSKNAELPALNKAPQKQSKIDQIFTQVTPQQTKQSYRVKQGAKNQETQRTEQQPQRISIAAPAQLLEGGPAGANTPFNIRTHDVDENTIYEHKKDYYKDKILQPKVQAIFFDNHHHAHGTINHRELIEKKKHEESQERDKILQRSKKETVGTVPWEHTSWAKNQKIVRGKVKLTQNNKTTDSRWEGSHSGSRSRVDQSASAFAKQDLSLRNLSHISVTSLGKNKQGPEQEQLHMMVQASALTQPYVARRNGSHVSPGPGGQPFHTSITRQTQMVQGIDQECQKESIDDGETSGYQEDIHRRQYKTSDPRMIYRNAQKERNRMQQEELQRELDMKKERIKQEKLRIQNRKAQRQKAGKGHGRYYSQSGQFETVKMKSMVTLEDLQGPDGDRSFRGYFHDTIRQHNNTEVSEMPFRIGVNTTRQKAQPFAETASPTASNVPIQSAERCRSKEGLYLDKEGTEHEERAGNQLTSTLQTFNLASHVRHGQNIHGHHLHPEMKKPVVVIETATPQNKHIMTQSDYLNGTPVQDKREQARPAQLHGERSSGKHEHQSPGRDSVLRLKHPQVNVNGSNVNGQKPLLEGGRNSQGAKTMTSNSFKTIIITNPWEQNKDNVQEELQMTNPYQFGGSFGGYRNSKMGVTAMALRSPGGGFKNQRSSQAVIDPTQPKHKPKIVQHFRKSGMNSHEKPSDLLESLDENCHDQIDERLNEDTLCSNSQGRSKDKNEFRHNRDYTKLNAASSVPKIRVEKNIHPNQLNIQNSLKAASSQERIQSNSNTQITSPTHTEIKR